MHLGVELRELAEWKYDSTGNSYMLLVIEIGPLCIMNNTDRTSRAVDRLRH